MTEDQFTMPSIAKQLAALEVGATFSYAEQIPSAGLPMLNESKRRFRQHYSPPIKRASDSTGQQYTLETTELITANGNIFVIALITRTA